MNRVKMADHQPNQKYNHESDVEPVEKRQKRDGNEVPGNASIVEVKTLTNIYYDCLERIFDFLDLESLFNVANTCKRLQIAADAKFGDDHGTTRVSISGRNSKYIFSFIRCFGAKITDLRVDFLHLKANAQNHLDRYINQYCADTLNTIVFENKQEFLGINFPTPFQNIERVYILGGNLGNQLPNFVNWFPNIRKLCMADDDILIDETAIAVNFPHLEELILFLSDNTRNQVINAENAVKLLHANPQIRSFVMYFTSNALVTCEQILNMIKGNPLNSTLNINEASLDMNAAELSRFVSERPLIEQLTLDQNLTADDAILLIGRLNLLKQFYFHIEDDSQCNRLLNQLSSEWQYEIDNSSIGDDIVLITLTR